MPELSPADLREALDDLLSTAAWLETLPGRKRLAAQKYREAEAIEKQLSTLNPT